MKKEQKKQKKSLRVGSETLRTLNTCELRQIAAGVSFGATICYYPGSLEDTQCTND